jgi:micrococcal nuclease
MAYYRRRWRRNGPPPSRLSRWWWNLRPWLLTALLLSLWPLLDPALVEPPAMLSSDPEQVSGTFTRCGLGRGKNCVIDGDTFKIGERNVRIIGIDAPETHPAKCEAEAIAGAAATAELVRVLNQGPFTMSGRISGDQDGYGRDLRALTRLRPDGTTQSVAADMLASGKVRRYLGGLRGGWC